MFKFPRKSKGILGMNARNLAYIRPSNPRRAIQLADDKLASKKLLKKKGLPTPRTEAIIHNQKELANFDWSDLGKSFVLKPNRGLGGEGILIVYGQKKNDNWVKADKKEVSIADLKGHILNILEGSFSLFNIPDIAFFEERLKILKLFKPYSFRGIPDIRIIVYNHVPVMAEMRIPTEESEGRANLHLGGLGVGIDIGTGITTTAIQHDHLVEYVPNTRLLLSGIKIPDWPNILALAIETQMISGIGFLGVDIAIDREKGPVILELNARPGLSIQIANLDPLKQRLKRVEGLKIKTIKRGVRVAQDLFGGEIEEEVEEITGKKVVGVVEKIKLFGKNDKIIEAKAKIDTGAWRTTICQTLADELELNHIVKQKKVRSVLGKEKRPIVKVGFVMDGQKTDTEAFVADRTEMKYDVIIGRRDLKRFIVEPRK